MIVIAKNIRI